jgi:LETM1 and EF-hand domain-containing protein 1
MFEVDYEGKIAVKDLKSALEVIRHRPSDEAIAVLLEKLDVDGDQFVPLEDIVSLAEGEGLGIVITEDGAIELAEDAEALASDIKAQGGEVKKTSSTAASGAEAADGEKKEKKEKKDDKPKLKKEDVVEA